MSIVNFFSPLRNIGIIIYIKNKFKSYTKEIESDTDQN